MATRCHVATLRRGAAPVALTPRIPAGGDGLGGCGGRAVQRRVATLQCGQSRRVERGADPRPRAQGAQGGRAEAVRERQTALRAREKARGSREDQADSAGPDQGERGARTAFPAPFSLLNNQTEDPAALSLVRASRFSKGDDSSELGFADGAYIVEEPGRLQPIASISRRPLYSKHSNINELVAKLEKRASETHQVHRRVLVLEHIRKRLLIEVSQETNELKVQYAISQETQELHKKEIAAAEAVSQVQSRLAQQKEEIAANLRKYNREVAMRQKWAREKAKFEKYYNEQVMTIEAKAAQSAVGSTSNELSISRSALKALGSATSGAPHSLRSGHPELTEEPDPATDERDSDEDNNASHSEVASPSSKSKEVVFSPESFTSPFNIRIPPKRKEPYYVPGINQEPPAKVEDNEHEETDFDVMDRATVKRISSVLICTSTSKKTKDKGQQAFGSHHSS
ncbi:hypothetical protein FI667_g6712, partial [Globisporangium splendens]